MKMHVVLTGVPGGVQVTVRVKGDQVRGYLKRVGLEGVQKELENRLADRVPELGIALDGDDILCSKFIFPYAEFSEGKAQLDAVAQSFLAILRVLGWQEEKHTISRDKVILALSAAA